jgi:hypothetical protein
VGENIFKIITSVQGRRNYFTLSDAEMFEDRSMKQGCQIFLGTNIPKLEKYTKGPQTTPNGDKFYQMAVKYTNIFHSMALQNIPKVGFLVLKRNHLATLLCRHCACLAG